MLLFLVFESYAQHCPSVPFFSQHPKPWGPKPLGLCSKSISDIGCAMTSVAMMIGYLDYRSGVDPLKLNNWLKNNNGYEEGCDINWIRAADYSSKVAFEDIRDTTNLSYLDKWMNKYRPAIVKVKNPSTGGPHYVVVLYKYAGKYYIHDPGTNQGFHLSLDKYGNKISRVVAYCSANRAPSKNQKIATTWANMKKR